MSPFLKLVTNPSRRRLIAVAASSLDDGGVFWAKEGSAKMRSKEMRSGFMGVRSASAMELLQPLEEISHRFVFGNHSARMIANVSRARYIGSQELADENPPDFSSQRIEHPASDDGT